MLFLFIFMPAMFLAIQGTACGIVGYVWKENRWVDGIWDYLLNLAKMAFQVTCSAAVIGLYVHFLGWPEPE